MRTRPYAQYLSRYSSDLADMMVSFHELNHYYGNQLILSVDSKNWELFDLRISKPIVSFPFKKVFDFRLFFNNLLHDMCNAHLLNSIYMGNRKLKRTEYYSIKRILNLYGFDEYFFTNKKLINYIVYGEIKKESDYSDNH